MHQNTAQSQIMAELYSGLKTVGRIIRLHRHRRRVSPTNSERRGGSLVTRSRGCRFAAVGNRPRIKVGKFARLTPSQPVLDTVSQTNPSNLTTSIAIKRS